jgi:lysophospholipid acyltransferase 5
MNLITVLLSKVTGLPEPTLRLLMTVVLGYPAAYFYNKKFVGRDASVSTATERTQYILLSGLALNVFFNVFTVYHSLLTLAASYGLCVVLGENMGNRKLAATGVWLFNAIYLLMGYYFMQTDDYDITWTMTQCILCLRMMGFAFDYYDGRKKVTVAGPPTKNELETVPKQELHQTVIRETAQKKTPAALPLSFLADTPLVELPNPMEFVAYGLFPSAFLVGPQFSFSLFKKWIHDNGKTLTSEQRDERDRAQAAYVLRSVVLAVIYLGLQQTIGATYSTAYLLTDEYKAMCFLKRAIIFTIAGKFAYNKYIGIWLLTEGNTHNGFWGHCWGGLIQIFRCNCFIWHLL